METLACDFAEAGWGAAEGGRKSILFYPREEKKKEAEEAEATTMSAVTAAVPFWRAAGMTYIGYSNVCAALVRSCLKEPFKTELSSREKVHFSLSKWTDEKQQKPTVRTDEE